MIFTSEGEMFEYDELSDEQRCELALLIARDNMERVNQDFQMFQPPNSFYIRYGKRILDCMIAGIALIISAPVNLVILIATYFDVGRPVLFKQTRIGRNGKPFTLVKFRNMRNDIDANGILLPPDQRVTKWGQFVRKTSLDELLNFWSILKGDMSVIGPRPMPLEYYERFSKRHNLRHLVRPGLECPMHGHMIDDMSWQTRFENDVWYVRNVSFVTDIKLLWGLIADTFWSSKRKMRGKGLGVQGGDFIGYSNGGQAIGAAEVPRKYFIELTKRIMKEKNYAEN